MPNSGGVVSFAEQGCDDFFHFWSVSALKARLLSGFLKLMETTAMT